MALVRISGLGVEGSDLDHRSGKLTETISRFILDWQEETGRQLAPRLIQPEIEKLASQIVTAANRELYNFFPEVGRRLMGTLQGGSNANISASNFGATGNTPMGALKPDTASWTWRALNQNYLKRKLKRQNPTYFKLSGALQNYFINVAENDTGVRQKLGSISASFVPDKMRSQTIRRMNKRTGDLEKVETIPMGTLNIRILPIKAATATRFDYLMRQEKAWDSILSRPGSERGFAKSLFRDAVDASGRSVAMKLMNRQTIGSKLGVNRPFLRPGLTLWAIQRIPQVIRRILYKKASR